MKAHKKLTQGFRLRSGLSLGELLIVVAIIMLLAITILFAISRQVNRANDSRRKQDLVALSNALEEYYNDKNTYPDAATWNAMNCKVRTGMDFLSKYFSAKKVPCDPQDNSAYHYELNPNGCTGFVLLAALRDTSDPDIARLGCAKTGCGYGFQNNYGVVSGNCQIPPVGFDPSAPPVPTPIPGVTPGNFACSAGPSNKGTCNSVGAISAMLYRSRNCPTFNAFVMCQAYCPGHPDAWVNNNCK